MSSAMKTRKMAFANPESTSNRACPYGYLAEGGFAATYAAYMPNEIDALSNSI
eukprot:CAMPEP_0196591462 /NCGR_PEP_ID=MMETSP1081-20130531/69686_1 /TAXON_ID=36882 /ORGANISM="Pyramimonas amylifera, Strain CCMP720" /LENGTH=52 /DNA_ID=CAMNT_0041914831 /DNA_START=395 /DNA_END=553 /DNA_ORIENTATION=+